MVAVVTYPVRVSGTEPQVQDVDYLTLDQQVCFALSVAARNIVSLYRPLLQPLGITHPQYLVMVALWEKEPLSVKEISKLLELESASVSPMLKRLQTAGLIERHRDTTDERVLQLTLTPQGRALKQEASSIPGAIAERLQMSIPDLEALRATLTHLSQVAQERVRRDSAASFGS